MSLAPVVSVVFPVFNESENIRAVYERVKETLLATGLSHEMVFVDDGSSDPSLDIIKSLAERDPAVQFVSLSRNFGHQPAIAAGLAHARGEAVISMDADLQHPPTLIPDNDTSVAEGLPGRIYDQTLLCESVVHPPASLPVGLLAPL